MSGKRAKRERKALRMSGNLTPATRTGRKLIRKAAALEQAREEVERARIEQERRNALTAEQRQEEDEAKRRRMQAADRRFVETLTAIASIVGIPGL